MKTPFVPAAIMAMICISACATIESYDGHLLQLTDSGHSKSSFVVKSGFNAEWPNHKILNNLMAMNRRLEEVKETSVDIKAVRHFRRNYADIIEYNWYKTEAGYLASCKLHGKDTRIIYDHRGMWQYNFSSYGENKMVYEIRDLVKSNYYDNEILGVRQYDFDRKSVYVVMTKDPKAKVVTLRIIDGKIEIL